jgi:hypothetical protein
MSTCLKVVDTRRAALTGVEVDKYFLGYEKIVEVCKRFNTSHATERKADAR